jgi:hypothetical protein
MSDANKKERERIIAWLLALLLAAFLINHCVGGSGGSSRPSRGTNAR